MAADEIELMHGRRAFAVAQSLLAGSPVLPPARRQVGWHDSATHPEVGSFGVVSGDGDSADLIGEVVRIRVGDRSAFVYVLGRRGVPTELSVTRRVFASLGLLAAESLDAIVEVVA